MKLLSLALAVALAGPGGVENGRYMGRTLARPMSHLGASWLDRAGRDQVQQPRRVLAILGVKPGQVVADVGCGSGYFTEHLARRVGPRGKVYATDVQEEMLAILRRRLATRELGNVVPVLATAEDPGLPRAALDLVLMVDVYHELQDPPGTLARLATTLRPGGRLAVVEYRDEDGSAAHIRPEHRMSLLQIKQELAANGWRFLSVDESLPEQRIVVFAPPPEQGPDAGEG